MTRRSGYQATREQFLADSSDAVIGSLTANSFFGVELKQRNAWLSVINQLKVILAEITDAYLFLEFTIPRMGRRVDALLLSHGCVFVIEYKVGSDKFSLSDIDQVVGYALDLKNFHEPSHPLAIFPILIATEAKASKVNFQLSDDKICQCILSNGKNLSSLITEACAYVTDVQIDPGEWVQGRYKPTPTIIEAAQALYRDHRVDDITRNEAGAENLSSTAAYVSFIIENCKRNQQKAICFITGVPGSGKTLAGLNIAALRTKIAEEEYAVFLSGNGPLVRVLRAALVRDRKDQAKLKHEQRLKREGARTVEQFIQNIHHFRDANLELVQPPIEKVILFDEAQRAWDKQTTSRFMRKKRNYPDFDESEPEFLLSVMDRHNDWCTVICLVGNGQEINTGEAGLGEWLIALSHRFPTWQVHLSERITAEPEVFGVKHLPPALTTQSTLHLATSIRSFRAEDVSNFASAMIDGRPEEALALSKRLDRFEFRLVRDIATARKWLRLHRRGTERAGIVAYSNAVRLKAEGIFVKARTDPEDWFLADRSDIRSSDYFEDVATEFDVQGLELDWVCVCIDANLRLSEAGSLVPFAFRGRRWEAVKNADRRRYVLNAHRVLLTRARQGVVIFVPKGSADDPTRLPRWYDDLYGYCLSCGVKPFN